MSTIKPRPTLLVHSDAAAIKAFRRTVRAYGRKRYRPMPWREDCSPYMVFVSEVMLQQTQADRVMEKFPPFIERFPGFAELAQAPLAEVFALWHGLGYNRRAKWLRDAAAQIMDRFGGSLPSDIEQLASLPGIGRNTAGAIAAYAFNAPAVYIETNIRTVFIHHFFPDGTAVSDTDIRILAEATLDRKNPRTWYWALMDYGTWLKKTQGNLSQKSGTHRRQSPFKESDRKIRGAIMRALNNAGASTAEALSEASEADIDKVRSLISSLTREGLIREENGLYRIGD